MFKKTNRKKIRNKKQKSIRKNISGTSDKPRLCVYRSLNNIFAQIIDDSKQMTIVSASTIDKDIKSEVEYGGNVEAAKVIGKKIAEKAKEKGIEEIVFDRSGYKYTGRIAALANEAREAGLKF